MMLMIKAGFQLVDTNIFHKCLRFTQPSIRGIRRRCVHLPLSNASHFSCHLWRLFSLMFLLFSCSSGVLLCCSDSCFLSTASTLMGIIPAITHTASSETMRKAEDTLRALSRLTTAIFRRYSLILRA